MSLLTRKCLFYGKDGVCTFQQVCTEGPHRNILHQRRGKAWLTLITESQSSEGRRAPWLPGPRSPQKSLQNSRPGKPSCLRTLATPPGWPGEHLSKTRLLAHPDGDVVVPVILGDQGHHRPVPGWVCGVDSDELLSAVLGEPVHLDGVAHGIGQEEHFNLVGEGNGFARVWRAATPRRRAQAGRGTAPPKPSSSPRAQPSRTVVINKQIIENG